MTCSTCQNTGKCFHCRGTGNCQKCHGIRHRGQECKACNGKLTCNFCNKGYCNECRGKSCPEDPPIYNPNLLRT